MTTATELTRFRVSFTPAPLPCIPQMPGQREVNYGQARPSVPITSIVVDAPNAEQAVAAMIAANGIDRGNVWRLGVNVFGTDKEPGSPATHALDGTPLLDAAQARIAELEAQLAEATAANSSK